MSDNTPPVTRQARAASYAAWRGLGPWNAYFIAKIILYATGALNFNAFYNLLFAAALLLPLRPQWLRGLRQILAIPAGIALLYHDSWYPPFTRLLAQPDVLDFSFLYLLELLNRFIDWNLVGAGFIFLVAYLFVSQWLRLTVFSVLALAWLAFSSLAGISLKLEMPGSPGMAPVMAQASTGGEHAGAQTSPAAPAPVGTGKPTSQQLDATLHDFFAAESTRRTHFPDKLGEEQPFDILFMHICSLSWADLDASGMPNHPLFQNMDVMFDSFSSVTGYSGPALLRLMRANCGQQPHSQLYQPTDKSCYLFENLQNLGFEAEAALNHNGKFQEYLQKVIDVGYFPNPSIPSSDQKAQFRAFDGSPVWGNLDTLNNWLSRREASGKERVALFYQTTTLHDGNREPLADGGSRSAPFPTRAQLLMDDINTFIGNLERSGRKVLIVFIPEHGAALKGDRMQISGMREIPSPSITQVPVGVRLVGGKAAHQAPVHVSGPTSYLALSELVARLLAEPLFEQDSIDWKRLTQDLPQTAAITENEGSVLIPWQDTPYIRMGKGAWMPYPK